MKYKMDNKYMNKQIGIHNTQKGNDEATTRLIADFSGSPPDAFWWCKGKAAAGKIRCGFLVYGVAAGRLRPQSHSTTGGATALRDGKTRHRPGRAAAAPQKNHAPNTLV